jgi:hypothetical protein
MNAARTAEASAGATIMGFAAGERAEDTHQPKSNSADTA